MFTPAFKYSAFCLLLLAGVARGQTPNPDRMELLDKLSKICGDRWNVKVDGDQLELSSKQTALGQPVLYNFEHGEKPYTLQFRFKIVEPISAEQVKTANRELEELRK